MIENIFTAEDMQQLKSEFKNVLIQQFKNEVEQNDTYLFDPSTVQELIEEVYNEILDELKPEIADVLKEQLLKKLDKFFKEELK